MEEADEGSELIGSVKVLSWFNWLVFLGFGSFSRANLVGLVLTCWFLIVNQYLIG